MTTIVPGRTTACALGLWSAYIFTWAAASGTRPAIVVLWWLAGLALVQAIGRSLPWKTHVAPALLAASARVEADALAIRHQADAVQDWESEGGAVARSL